MTCDYIYPDGTACERKPAYAYQRYCDTHALRWTPRQSVERSEPAWVRRMRDGRGIAKDMTRSAA